MATADKFPSMAREAGICAIIAAVAFLVTPQFLKPTSPPASSRRASVESHRLSAIPTGTALREARELTLSGQASSQLWQALDGFSNQQFEKLLAEALSEEGTYLSLQLLIAKWCEYDPAAATAAVDSASYVHAMPFWISVELWAEKDPEAAFEYLLKRRPNSNSSAAYRAIFAAMRRTGRDDSAALLERMLPEHQNVGSSVRLAESLRENGAVALEQIREMKVPMAHRSQAAWSISALALDFGPARDVIAVYDADTTWKLGAVPDNVVTKFYTEDPEAALEWINDPQHLRRTARYGVEIANSLADSKPDEAARILLDLPRGVTRAEALNNFSMRWDDRDPDAAEAWRASLSDGDQKLLEGAE